jgi:tetratricopeptide (TPR) repeat protein
MSEARFTPHYLLENLRDVYFAERSGALTLSRRSEWRRLYFYRGMVALADSSVGHENLDAVLAASGVSLPRPGASSLPAPERAEEILARRLASPAAVEAAARSVVERAVCGAFQWDGGTFRFDDREVPTAAFAPDVLFTFEVFQRGVQAMANFAPLKEVLLDEERRLRLNDNAFLPIQSLNLGAEQGYVLSRVDGSVRIRDVAVLAPEGMEDRLVRLLFGYLVLGLVLFDPPAGEGMFALRDLMEEHRGGRRRDQEDRSEIREFFERLRGLDAAGVLGVTPEDGPEVLKRAYDALRERFRRDRFAPQVRGELRRELTMIENRMLESYLALQSAAIERYTPTQSADGTLQAAVFEKRKELVKTEAQETEEENQRLAEKYFLKAKEYFKEGDYFNCIQFCRLAVKFNPAEAPFFALMGDALLRNPDRRWQRLAEESYLKAVEIDPWNAEYLVSLGVLYKAQGLGHRARRQFEKALEILPHHARAREELRTL